MRPRGALALALVVLATPPARARALVGAERQEQEQEQEEAPNAPSRCPYCHGDPERMAAAGVVSHGGFAFGASDTATQDAMLPEATIVWIETAHFELGLGVGDYRIEQSERLSLRDELEELAQVLPRVPTRARTLDPWLRAHLYAMRLQKFWARMEEILQVTDEDFPSGQEPWMLGQPYHGEGPHLGQKGKYEVFVLPSRELLTRSLREQFGLNSGTTQRWNVAPTSTLSVHVNAAEPNLRQDAALHGHLVFCLTINLLDGYENYAYDTPHWLREGLAHYLERELDPSFNSFSSSESALPDETRRADWCTPVRRMIQTRKAPRLAEMVHLVTPAQFSLRHHYTSWSMTAFLVERHPDGYACLQSRLHGCKTPEGMADGSSMADKHREAFEECIGMRYAAFDEAWSEWALEQSHRERQAAGKDLRKDDVHGGGSSSAR